MRPKTRSRTSAPADAPRRQLVSAVLAIIDRIGEMVAAIEAGEEMPARRRQCADRRARARC